VGVVTLTDGGADSTACLLASAGLDSLVDRVLSVDDAGAWKPAPARYRYAADAVGRPPEELALVAVHGWDIHGARRAGLVSGWIRRLEGNLAPTFAPVVPGTELADVVDRLRALGS
jgi:2-haloacid dehalogenase